MSLPRIFPRSPNNQFSWIAVIPLLLLLQFDLSTGSAQVAEELGWSLPVELSADQEGMHYFPYIIGDPAGGVHVFWTAWVLRDGGSQTWVEYTYWDGEIWSLPIDAFAGDPTTGFAIDARGVVDASGFLHTIWIDEHGLEYARRHISSPVSARSWESPVTLDSALYRMIGPAKIILGNEGEIYVAYLHPSAEPPGVYFLRSEDHGDTWSLPALVSDPNWPAGNVGRNSYFGVDLLLVEDVLHLVWQQPDGDLGYARSAAPGLAWSSPMLLPPGNWPRMVALDAQRLLILAIGSPPGDEGICFKMQYTSSDEGLNWSGPEKILQPQIKGCLGVDVALDADGRANMVASAYTNLGGGVAYMWYSQFDNGMWLPPQLMSWPAMPYPSLGDQPDFPTAAITEGNLLHAVFHVTEGRIWYTSRRLSAAWVQPAASIPSPTIPVVNTATPLPSLAAPTPTLLAPLGQAPGQTIGTFSPIYLASAISLVLILVVLVIRLIQANQYR